MSNSEIVDVDGSDSSTCCPVTDIINIIPEPVGDIGGLCSVRNSDIDACDNFRLESDYTRSKWLLKKILD